MHKTNDHILFNQPFRSSPAGDTNKTRTEHTQDQEAPMLEPQLMTSTACMHILASRPQINQHLHFWRNQNLYSGWRCMGIHIYIYTYVYIRVASSGHGTAPDIDKMLRGAKTGPERAGRATQQCWHGMAEMPARHGTDNMGTSLWHSTAGKAQAG